MQEIHQTKTIKLFQNDTNFEIERFRILKKGYFLDNSNSKLKCLRTNVWNIWDSCLETIRARIFKINLHLYFVPQIIVL